MYRNILKKFFEWKELERILHIFTFIFSIYAIYLFYTNKKNRNIYSVLLFSILFSVDTLLHHNINIKNK